MATYVEWDVVTAGSSLKSWHNGTFFHGGHRARCTLTRKGILVIRTTELAEPEYEWQISPDWQAHSGPWDEYDADLVLHRPTRTIRHESTDQSGAKPIYHWSTLPPLTSHVGNAAELAEAKLQEGYVGNSVDDAGEDIPYHPLPEWMEKIVGTRLELWGMATRKARKVLTYNEDGGWNYWTLHIELSPVATNEAFRQMVSVK